MLTADGVLAAQTPEWAEPLLAPRRIKGAKGGRSSGKSHFFAEDLILLLVEDPNQQWVCIREIQKSLKFSAKKTLEGKIRKLGVSHLFDIRETEIRRRGGDGLLIFQGMQDHTADSIKSLEGFDGAWVEEAQSMSKRSLELLEPTIRKPGSQIWFSWNPDQPDDAVEQLFNDMLADVKPSRVNGVQVWETEACVLVHVNYTDNPWCPKEMKQLAARQRRRDYERYVHIWLGGFNTKSEKQIFQGLWRVDDFVPQHDWEGPFQGGDFGFAKDPSCAVRCWIHDNVLYIEYDSGKTGLELDEHADFFKKAIPGFERFPSRWDSARPESIAYLRKPTDPEGRPKSCLPRAKAVVKWPGSVKDGIEFIKTFDEIVIHTRCVEMQEEARLYSYKVIKRSGDITDEPEDEYDHRWDSVRYALAPLIKRGKRVGFYARKKRAA